MRASHWLSWSFGLWAATLTGEASGQNLVVNGSFEDPQHANLTVDDGLGLYWYRRLTSPAVTGWTHDSPLAVFRTRPGFWLSQDGSQYLELESGFGSYIEQTLTTRSTMSVLTVLKAHRLP